MSVYEPKVIEARDEIQMAPESQESPQTPAVSMSEDVVRKECECKQKLIGLITIITTLLVHPIKKGLPIPITIKCNINI